MSRMDSLTHGFAMVAAVIGSSLFIASGVHAQEVVEGTATVVEGYAAPCDSCNERGGLFNHHRKYGSFAEWRSAMKQKHDHYHQIAQQVAQRNAAWPKPFDCADRQLYFSIWEPMIDKGYERQTMLMDQHFDTENNELNDYGKSYVSAVMRNMPTTRKRLFIQRHPDPMVAESRLAAVRNAVSLWYGDELAANVGFTDSWAPSHSGERIGNVNRLYSEGLPAPLIPVATGTGSTSNVAFGN